MFNQVNTMWQFMSIPVLIMIWIILWYWFDGMD